MAVVKAIRGSAQTARGGTYYGPDEIRDPLEKRESARRAPRRLSRGSDVAPESVDQWPGVKAARMWGCRERSRWGRRLIPGASIPLRPAAWIFLPIHPGFAAVAGSSPATIVGAGTSRTHSTLSRGRRGSDAGPAFGLVGHPVPIGPLSGRYRCAPHVACADRVVCPLGSITRPCISFTPP